MACHGMIAAKLQGKETFLYHPLISSAAGALYLLTVTWKFQVAPLDESELQLVTA